PFLLHCSRHHRPLHSFPTRRSSDLAVTAAVALGVGQAEPAQVGQLAPEVRRVAAFILLQTPDEGGRAVVAEEIARLGLDLALDLDRKSTRLNSSHVSISYAVFCLKK